VQAVQKLRFAVLIGVCVTSSLLGSELAGPALAGPAPAGPALAGPALAGAGVAASASVKVSAARSGLRWASGVFMPDYRPPAFDGFGAWRGAKVDLALTYSGHASWSELIDPTWLYDAWAKAPQALVISAAPFPDSPDPGNPQYSVADCASGDYDEYWQQFGSDVAAAGLAGRVVVRLAWEFNGDWNPWAATDPAQFVECWRQVYRSAESTAPALRWDWTVNRGPSGALDDPRDAWPGIHYVDIVGIDSYDGYPAVLDEAGWQKQYAGPQGLKFWADFAKRKGKPFSVPEWGLYPGTGWAGHNGGDNKYYISKMFGFFRSLGRRLSYEAYFDDDNPAQAGALKLNPRGAKEYVRQIKLSRRAG
jgi:Glycosyl hydrolase family 26